MSTPPTGTAYERGRYPASPTAITDRHPTPRSSPALPPPIHPDCPQGPAPLLAAGLAALLLIVGAVWALIMGAIALVGGAS